MKRIVLIALVVSAVTAAVLSTGRSRAQAQPNISVGPQLATFGMVGLAANQTARLNAVGQPMGGPIIAGASCEVTLEFFNDQGASLKTSMPLKVVGGQSVQFDLQRGDIDGDSDRREVRGTVRTSFVGPQAAAIPVVFGGCSVIPTLEVFDQESGRTMAVLESTHALPFILPLAGGQ
jgi:hypothetical protein